MNRIIIALAAWAAFFAAVGCSGQMASGHNDPDEAGSGGDTAPAGGTGGTSRAGGNGGSATAFTPARGGLRRLTSVQLRATLDDLLGPGLKIPAPVEADQEISGFAAIGAARIAVSAPVVEGFETAALDLAQQTMADTSRRKALTGCDPAGVTDDRCARAFVERFGRRAFRRPLQPAEVDRYVKLAASAAQMQQDFWKGLGTTLSAFLQSPYFLYRTELGASDDNRAQRALTAHELATRLSYTLWNTTPDDALLDAADKGSLNTPAGVQAEAKRLLDSPRAPAAVRAFATEMLALGNLDQLQQPAATFPQVTATLGASMREETLSVIADAFSNGKDWRELFDTRETFVNAELAKLYGVTAPAGNGFSRVTLPDGARAGLLGHGSFLAAHSHPASTSPTRRGKAILETILCQDVPPPPNDVVPEIPPNKPGAETRTLRERLADHRKNPTCAACHAALDPPGLAFEQFDAIGAFRTTDAGKPIDASGTLNGESFTDARGFVGLLRKQPDVPNCLVRNLYRWTTGHVETDGEMPALQEFNARFTDGGHQLRALLTALVTSEAFHTVGAPQ